MIEGARSRLIERFTVWSFRCCCHCCCCITAMGGSFIWLVSQDLRRERRGERGGREEGGNAGDQVKMWRSRAAFEMVVILTHWNAPKEAKGPLVGFGDAMRENVPPIFSVHVTHRRRERLQDKEGLPLKWKTYFFGGEREGVQQGVFKWSSNTQLFLFSFFPGSCCCLLPLYTDDAEMVYISSLRNSLQGCPKSTPSYFFPVWSENFT